MAEFKVIIRADWSLDELNSDFESELFRKLDMLFREKPQVTLIIEGERGIGAKVERYARQRSNVESKVIQPDWERYDKHTAAAVAAQDSIHLADALITFQDWDKDKVQYPTPVTEVPNNGLMGVYVMLKYARIHELPVRKYLVRRKDGKTKIKLQKAALNEWTI